MLLQIRNAACARGCGWAFRRWNDGLRSFYVFPWPELCKIMVFSEIWWNPQCVIWNLLFKAFRGEAARKVSSISARFRYLAGLLARERNATVKISSSNDLRSSGTRWGNSVRVEWRRFVTQLEMKELEERDAKKVLRKLMTGYRCELSEVKAVRTSNIW